MSNNNNKKLIAFALAEVLVTLAIIGVVSAITIPVVQKNTRRNIMEKRLVSVVSTLNSAFRMSEVYNGGMSGWDLSGYRMQTKEEKSEAYKKRLDFFSVYLRPYIKTINDDLSKKISLKALGYTKPWTYPNGVVYLETDRDVYPIVLNNGTVLIHTTGYGKQPNNDTRYLYWIHIFADLDGPKGQNIIGKDIFSFVIPLKSGFSLRAAGNYHYYEFSTDEYSTKYTLKQMKDICKTGKTPSGVENAYFYCGYLIEQNGWKVPKDYPWL